MNNDSHTNDGDDRAVSRRTLLRGAAITAAVLSLGPTNRAQAASPSSARKKGVNATPVKTRATYYTPERVAAARSNIATYDWAQSLSASAIADAAPLLAKGDEWCWSQVTTQRLPRTYTVNQPLGSPITGTAIYNYGAYPWTADVYNEPWKIVDPSSGYVFPTNDFWSFYQSALDSNGNFDPALGDPQYLVNTLYPERGPSWGVDNGYGWIDENNQKWLFVAYYNHWFCWFARRGATAYHAAATMDGIRKLANAYIYTGDPQYAHTGVIMLDRVADVYPSLDTVVYKASDGFRNNGNANFGKAVGSIWEAWLAADFIAAYDAFYPAIATSDTANVVPFLRDKATQLGLPTKHTIGAIRANIEQGLLRQIFPAVTSTRIYGNFGMHQTTLAMAGVILDNIDETRQWFDFNDQAGGWTSQPTYAVTGGDISRTLVDKVDRDGHLDAAPGYNSLSIAQIRSIADVMAGYDAYPTADLYQNVKVRKLFQSRRDIAMLNTYMPEIGDSGRIGLPGLLGTAQDYTAAFERFHLHEDAQLAYLLNGDTADGLYVDIFSTRIAETQQQISDTITNNGPLNLESIHLTGYGLAVLRDNGIADDAKAGHTLWLYHGRNSGHGHKNVLALGMYGHGVELLPPLGYPTYTDTNNRRFEWESNTIANNTVVVDATPQTEHTVGTPTAFLTTPDVQAFDVDASTVYPQTSMYRRAAIMVRIDDNRWYTVDVFRVVGGTQHHYSFHTAGTTATVSGITMVPQSTGTYAGPTINQPADQKTYRPNASGFDWLGNVERGASPTAPVKVDWPIPDTWNVADPDPNLHLTWTLVGGSPYVGGAKVDEIATVDGVPAQNASNVPPSLRYVIARRQAPSGATSLTSQFVATIETHLGAPAIADVQRVPISARSGATMLAHESAAVRVTLTDGRVQYVISSIRPTVPIIVDHTINFTGAIGVATLTGGILSAGVMHDATELALTGQQTHGGPYIGAYTGTVSSFTTEFTDTNDIILTLSSPLDAAAAARLVDMYVYVTNDGIRNACYRIVAVELLNPTELRLNIGDVTLVRSYIDATNPNAGYTYDIAVNATARIPLTHSWAI